jgi:protein ImuB
VRKTRQIACITIPHFIAQAEGSDTPLLVHADGAVLDACEEALARGVYPGQPLPAARALCPEARLAGARPARYRDLWESLVERLAAHTPCLEAESLGVAYAEAAGMGQLYGSVVAWCEALGGEARAVNLSLRVGVAENKFCAWIAAQRATADAPYSSVTEAAGAFLAPLSLAYIPFDDETRRRLVALGIRTMGQFARLSATAAAEQFGPEWLEWHGRARGRDDRPVLGQRSQTVEAGREFDPPVLQREAILAVGLELGQDLLMTLRREGLAARRLELEIILAEGTEWRRGVTPRQRLDVERLPLLLGELLAELDAESRGVAELRLRLTGVAPAGGQQLALFPERAGGMEQEERYRHLARRQPAHALYLARVIAPDALLVAERYRLAEFVL